MSRKRFFVVYFFVALAISVPWELATPGIADIRPAAIVGHIIGQMFGWFFLPSVLIGLYQAVRRSRSDNYLEVFSTCAAAVVFLYGVLEIYNGTLRPAQIHVSEFFTNDYKTFVRVARSSCAESATGNKPKSGLTDPQINTYCQCAADNLANELTVVELNASLGPDAKGSASIEEKAPKVALQCANAQGLRPAQ
jgi:hypothetical protein